MASPARWPVAAAIIGVVLALLGPFGSYMNHGPLVRFGYWMAAALMGMLFYVPGVKAATSIAPPGTRARWPVLIGATLVASVPEAIITWFLAFWTWPGLARFGLSGGVWYTQTATVGLIVMLAILFLQRRADAGPQEGVMPPAVAAPIEPLPRDVLALQMEDHYVRVHTPSGSALMLMPLGSTIAGVTVEGLRTHRSWWVARHAVTAVEGTPRAMRLRLSNGVVAPVSRTAVTHLKSAGWIAT